MIAGLNGKARRFAPHIFQIARFGMVGVASTLIDLALANLLAKITAWPLQLINIVAFLCAFGFSFSGHYFWTFRRGAPLLRSLARFFVVAMCGLGVSTVMLQLLIHVGFGGRMEKLTISILIIPPVTFLAGKLWAFAE